MLGINIETDLREKMFSHIQKLSFRFFDNNKTGHLMGRITNDLNDVGEVAHHGPEDVFIAVMTLLGSFSLMAYINLELALLTFIIVPFMAWLIIKFGGRMTTTYRQLFRNVGNFNARIEDNVGVSVWFNRLRTRSMRINCFRKRTNNSGRPNCWLTKRWQKHVHQLYADASDHGICHDLRCLVLHPRQN